MLKYNLKKVRLVDIGNNEFTGTANYCNKEDYEAKEDGIDIPVKEDIWIFYKSDIKSIEILK